MALKSMNESNSVMSPILVLKYASTSSVLSPPVHRWFVRFTMCTPKPLPALGPLEQLSPEYVVIQTRPC